VHLRFFEEFVVDLDPFSKAGDVRTDEQPSFQAASLQSLRSLEAHTALAIRPSHVHHWSALQWAADEIIQLQGVFEAHLHV